MKTVKSLTPTFSVWEEIADQSPRLEGIANRVAANSDLIPEIFAGLNSEKARIRYGCLKVLQIISESKPAVLYPFFEKFVDLLDIEKTIIQWGAIIILGNLASVDTENKIDRILDRYLQPIPGPVMITAANCIGGAGKIAAAKPRLANKIAQALLQVEQANYKTAECRNVALGHVVQAFEKFFPHVKKRQPVFDFMQRQLDNRRNAVKRKASVFLKKYSSSIK